MLSKSEFRVAVAASLFCLVVGSTVIAVASGEPEGPKTATASVEETIDKLKKQIRKLKRQVREVSKQQGPAGPQGNPGEQGPPGPAVGPAGGDLAGSYPNPTIGPNAVGTAEVDGSLTGADIANNSLNGDDVDESLLGQVPAAALGGIGRDARTAFDCPATGLGLVTCAGVDLDLPSATRVLVIADVTAHPAATGTATGSCYIVIDAINFVGRSEKLITVGDTMEDVSMSVVTAPVGTGTVSFALDCNESSGEMVYARKGITAVALSPN